LEKPINLTGVRMHLAQKLHEEVYLYEDVFSDPKGLIDLIEELDSDETTHSVVPEWGFWFSNSQDGHSFGSKKDFNPESLDQLDSPRKAEVEHVVKTIQKAIKDVADAYYRDRGLDGEPNMSPFVGIMKYREGCEMGAHFDAQAGDRSLKFSIVLYLNEDYEGGEISFIVRPYDLRNPKNSHLQPATDIDDPSNKDLVDFTVKPKAASALIFPSVHPYKHQVHVIKKGDKYIFPGFVFHEDFDPEDPASREKYNAGSLYEEPEQGVYFDEE
jgi:hypothetical protein